MTETENQPSEAEATAELAKPEDVTEYVEQRREDEAGDRIKSEAESEVRRLTEKTPELKEARKASRSQRYKIARDKYKAEAEDLRSRLGQNTESREAYSETDTDTGINPRDSGVDHAPLERSLEAARHMHGDGFDKAYEAFVEYAHRTRDQEAYQRIMTSADPGVELVRWHEEQGFPVAEGNLDLESEVQRGRQEQEFQQQLQARDAEIRVQEGARIRAETFAAQCPDFHETLQSIDGLDELPPQMLDLIRRSPVSAEMAYLMAKDFWSPNSMGILEQAQQQGDPIAQARFVGALEQVIMTNRSKGGLGVGTGQRGATQAPPPLAPVRGGASAPRDLHSLSKGDDVSDYIRARRSNP